MNAIHKIKLIPGTNKFGLLINGKVLESDDGSNFDTSTDLIKLITTRNLPLNVNFNFTDFEEKYRTVNMRAESPALSLYRIDKDNCRVQFNIYCDLGLWNLKIDTDEFLKLKKGV